MLASKAGKLNFHIFCALSFFSFGTAMMDYFLVYPSRAIVGNEEFVAYHALLETAILPVSVVPFFIITVQNVFLFWFRPANVEKGLVVVSLCCLLFDWASSIFVQIPMNLQLNEGKDITLIQEVMDTNWDRVFLESTQAFFVLIMMVKGGSNE
ncbi:hypothetical protein KK083_09595 [Fulvivirgaceae bacterium PWU4]|uniref:Uncharacterized protein n=1 Tax=Chryseosolibacter histidini TaxID=2782349 RepID=A0AAP2DIR9_9BACT|nr:hypothetical protein [Chryseosolibacter histidini]MBT1697128.1 hypothetical protein [Chryseosolibacter histidini]